MSYSYLIPTIVQAFHERTHEGVHKTLQRVRAVFYWKGLQNHVRRFIQHCDICQHHKCEQTKAAGLLSPLPIPCHVWTDISMDFIDGLPSSKGHTTILVVVDHLSKYGHFIPLHHPYTATMVAQVFFIRFLSFMGCPNRLCVIGTLYSLAYSGGYYSN